VIINANLWKDQYMDLNPKADRLLHLVVNPQTLVYDRKKKSRYAEWTLTNNAQEVGELPVPVCLG
jgi:hypothetical protein